MDMQAKIQKGGSLAGQRPAGACRAREDARREADDAPSASPWRGERGDEDRFGYRLPGGPAQLGADETEVTPPDAGSHPAMTSKETPIGMSTATEPQTDPHAATLATLARAFGDGVFATSRFRDNLRLFVPPSRLPASC